MSRPPTTRLIKSLLTTSVSICSSGAESNASSSGAITTTSSNDSKSSFFDAHQHQPYPHQQYQPYEPYKPNGSYHQFNNNGQSYPLSSTTMSSTMSSALTLSSSSTLSSALTLPPPLPPPQQAPAPVTRPTNNRVAAVHFDDSINGSSSSSASSNGSGSHIASATTVAMEEGKCFSLAKHFNGTGGVNAYWKDIFSDTSKLSPNFDTTATTDAITDGTANDARFHRTSNSQVRSEVPPIVVDTNYGNFFTESLSADITSSSSSMEDVNWDVRPDQIFSSTSEAMWTLSPPSTSLLDKEFAISSIAEEFGIGDQEEEVDLEFWIDLFKNRPEDLPDLTISASTMNVPPTTQIGKKKRKPTWDFNGGEYVEPAEDSQDYSKSDGLVYSKDPHAKGLKLDKEPLDEEKVKEGRWYVHATPAANLFDPTITNLEHHSFDLHGGIMEQGLQPMVQTGKKSKKPIEGVWALPGGRVMSSIAHIVRTHAEALKKSGGKIALIMIYADDDRINKFTRMGGSTWAQTCHPAYSREEIPVYPKDVLIVDIKELPVFLKEIKVRTDLIPLKTDAEKKATRDLWYHQGGGKERRLERYHNGGGKEKRAERYEPYYKQGGGREKQAKRSAERYHQEGGREKKAKWYHDEGGKEEQAARFLKWYHQEGGKEKRAEQTKKDSCKAKKTNRPRRTTSCNDTTLGPNGVLKCRLDTTLSHSRLKKKGDKPRCALHKWAGPSKSIGIEYCESCNVHLCNDCFTSFHTIFDLVTVKNQILKTDPEELGAHAALVRQQQQQQSLQSAAAASSSSSSAPLLGWTGGNVLQGNNGGGGGGCGTPSSSTILPVFE